MTTNTVTLKLNTTSTVKPAAKTITAAQIGRTLVHKWDLFAVIGLMLTSAAYSLLVLGGVA